MMATGAWVLAANAALGLIISPHNLTVEYHSAPIIDVAPRFSWIPVATTADARNVSQAAYRLQLFGSTKNAAPLWDSRRIASTDALHVPLPSSVQLASDSAYRWRVQLWDDSGGEPSPWSPNASFGTALLQQTDWRAPWIASDWPQQQLRLRFSLPYGKAVAQARVYAASGGYSVIVVNGVNANAQNGNEELGPWTSWSERILYKCYDVKDALHAGADNVVGVWLGRGQFGKYAHVYDDWRNNTWNASNSGWPATRDTSMMPAWQNKSGKLFNNRGSVPGGLRLQISVVYSDGSRNVFGENLKGWEASHGPIGWNDPGGMGCAAGEDFDATKYERSWATTTSSMTNWSSGSVRLLSPDAPTQRARLSADFFTPIRALQERWPVVLESTGPGAFVFWFAENYVGRACSGNACSVLHNLNLPRGTRLRLSYAMQMVCPNGTVALVGCENGTLFYPEKEPSGLDTFTVAGSANEELTTHFVYHGYQFVLLTGWPVDAMPPTLRTLSGVVMHSDTAPTAKLTFPQTKGGKLLRKINDAAIRTLHSNHFSVETDGLSERNGWAGDSQATCESAVRSLNMASFYTKWMQDVQDAQNCAGMKRTPGCAPGSLSPTIPYTKHDPPYDLTWISNYAQEVALLHKYHGDRRIVERHYGSLKLYVEYARNVTSCPHCTPQCRDKPRASTPPHLPWYGWAGDWMEWRDLNENIGSSGAISAAMHFILDLETLRDFANILGKVADATKYTQLSAQYRAQFQQVFLGRYHRVNRTVDPAVSRSYCVPCFLQGNQRTPCTCQTQAQQIIPLFASSAPVGRMLPLVTSTGAEAEVFGTLLQAIKCPVSPSYADAGCSLSTDPQLKGGVFDQGLNFSTANATQWNLCWQQGPDCSRGPRMNTGLVTTSKILPVLTQYGNAELALDLALSTKLPSWGYIIEHGGSTYWEGWSGMPYSSGTRSCHNQHQDAGIGLWLHDWLVGFQAAQDGVAFSSIVIAPAITTSAALPSMRGEYATPRGRVVVSWSRDTGGVFSLNVTAPVNTRVLTRLPTLCRDGARVTESGRVLWPAADAVKVAGISPIVGAKASAGGGVTVDVQHGSGSFCFLSVCDLVVHGKDNDEEVRNDQGEWRRP